MKQEKEVDPNDSLPAGKKSETLGKQTQLGERHKLAADHNFVVARVDSKQKFGTSKLYFINPSQNLAGYLFLT